MSLCSPHNSRCRSFRTEMDPSTKTHKVDARGRGYCRVHNEVYPSNLKFSRKFGFLTEGRPAQPNEGVMWLGQSAQAQIISCISFQFYLDAKRKYTPCAKPLGLLVSQQALLNKHLRYAIWNAKRENMLKWWKSNTKWSDLEFKTHGTKMA